MEYKRGTWYWGVLVMEVPTSLQTFLVNYNPEEHKEKYVSNVVVEYMKNGERLGIFGIPNNLHEQNLRLNNLKTWSHSVFYNFILPNTQDAFTLAQKITGSRTRLWFDFEVDSAAWNEDIKMAAQQRAIELARIYWNLKRYTNVNVCVMPHSSKNGQVAMVRAVFYDLYVDILQTQEMLAVDAVTTSMRENKLVYNILELTEVAGGAYCLYVPLIGSPLKGRVPVVPCNNVNDCVNNMPYMLGGDITFSRRAHTNLGWSPIVKEMVNAHKKEVRRAENLEKERQEVFRESLAQNAKEEFDLRTVEEFDESHVLSLVRNRTDEHDVAFVEYLNKFIVHIASEDPTYAVKRMDPRTGVFVPIQAMSDTKLKAMYPELVLVWSEADEDGKIRKQRLDIIDEWLKSTSHLKVAGVKFAPGMDTLFFPNVRRWVVQDKRHRYLNSCPDFAYSVLKEKYEQDYGSPPRRAKQKVPVCGHPLRGVVKFVQDVEFRLKNKQAVTPLEIIIRHIFRVYCNEDEVMYTMFCAFFRHMFVNPAETLKCALVIVGSFGTGKTVFLSNLGTYAFGAGPLYQYFGGDMKRIGSRFNSSYDGLFTFIDEAGNTDLETSEIIKSLITDKLRMKEAKFRTPSQEENYSNFVLCGNSIGLKVKPGDRRFWMLRCKANTRQKMISGESDMLADACGANGDPRGIYEWVTWLLEQDYLDDFDFNTTPIMTEFKSEHIRKHLKSCYVWWHDTLENGCAIPHTTGGHSISPFLKGGQWGDNEEVKEEWNGKSTWSDLNTSYKSWLHASNLKNELSMSEFIECMSACLVVKVGSSPDGLFKATYTREVFFGCLDACKAQFDAFIKHGAVHEEYDARTESWVDQLFANEYARGNTHGYHNSCGKCMKSSKLWKLYQETDGMTPTLKAKVKKALLDYKSGIVPDAYKKKKKKNTSVPPPSEKGKEPMIFSSDNEQECEQALLDNEVLMCGEEDDPYNPEDPAEALANTVD